MDSTELRAVQEPLKDAYRKNPAEALVTLRASGQLDDQAVACSVATGRELAVAGLHPATGGDGSLLCSGDMLLQALAACAGVTLRAVAISLGIPLAGGTVTAEGDLDFRGTLAVSKEAPVGFSAVRLAFDLDTEATAEQVQTLIRLTERYCVVYQTLANPPQLTMTAGNGQGASEGLRRTVTTACAANGDSAILRPAGTPAEVLSGGAATRQRPSPLAPVQPPYSSIRCRRSRLFGRR